MKRRVTAFLIGIACLVLIMGSVQADAPPRFGIPWAVIGKGGKEMASTNYAIKSTIGQAAVGRASSSSYGLRIGYWYGQGKGMHGLYLPLTLKG